MTRFNWLAERAAFPLVGAVGLGALGAYAGSGHQFSLAEICLGVLTVNPASCLENAGAGTSYAGTYPGLIAGVLLGLAGGYIAKRVLERVIGKPAGKA